ncbi:hypothetical protein [Parasitella parasitica]|uniref:Uncharacterized protein n=1 Tax=Parasitella parasitica TaxID=35722 RepID=A0A0B7MWL2_9FUNG|nr:hypothetical protein [Parasitella parasitica]
MTKKKQHDPEANEFSQSVYATEWFPFEGKIHKLLNEFYYRIDADISQAHMRNIHNLVEKVVDAKARNPSARVPAIDRVLNFHKRLRNRIPVMKTTEHTVAVKKTENGRPVDKLFTFSMNAPSELIKLLVANPSITNKVSLLPDETPGELVESNQGYKWRTHKLFQHPMVTLNSGQHVQDLWVGDLVRSGDVLYMLARFFTVNHTHLMVDAFKVELDSSTYCTYFVHAQDPMLPAIVDDLALLKKVVEMLTPEGEKVLVVAPVQFITADNARHAEIASSRGATSSRPCRKCDWELTTTPKLDGTDYMNRGYKLVGGQALLKLEAFDTMIDNPIEVLHTGFKRKLTSLRLHNSFVGRDYKILLQQLSILLEQLLERSLIQDTPGLQLIKGCLESLGRLISLIYISKITSNTTLYIQQVHEDYWRFKRCVLEHDLELQSVDFQFLDPSRKLAGLHNSSKMHVLCHLTEDIIRSFVKRCLEQRHHPSRDAAVAFGKRTMMMHIMSGGYWADGNGIWTRATEKVLQSRSQYCVNNAREFVDNNDAADNKEIKGGATGLFRGVSGELFVGEVQKMDPIHDTVTIMPFGFLLQGPNNNVNCKYPLIAAPSGSLCLNDSRGYNLLNISKMGAFWFALTHLPQ